MSFLVWKPDTSIDFCQNHIATLRNAPGVRIKAVTSLRKENVG